MKQMNEQQLNKGKVLHINRQSTDKGKTKSDTKIRSMNGGNNENHYKAFRSHVKSKRTGVATCRNLSGTIVKLQSLFCLA